MNENQITALLNMLLLLWEGAITREETLKLILEDSVPGWRYEYRDSWNDIRTLEFVMKTVAPMRGAVKAAIQGELKDSALLQAIQEVQRKPN